MESLKDKKVLIMGLGILGGGIAAVRWAVAQGAQVTVTDLKTEEQLSNSLKKLNDIKGALHFTLGKHTDSDFENTDMVIVNPDIPLSSPFLQIARSHGAQIENELTLFLSHAPTHSIAAVTGTRGKTTTANWLGFFLRSLDSKALVTGNSPDEPLLGTLDKINSATPVVIESPSFLLEHLTSGKGAPHIAIITNLFQDHLNRHGTMENYADTKANIFKNQTASDFVIFNYDNEWSLYFLKLNPKSKTLFFSLHILPPDKEGIYIQDGEMKIRLDGKEMSIMNVDEFIQERGPHNLENLLASSLAAFISGVSIEDIKMLSKDLPEIRFRQEKVFDQNGISIYNDTNATSPDGTIAALRRFGKKEGRHTILISGGTDRILNYEEWAEKVKETIEPENLVLLAGSATEKMKTELSRINFGPIHEFDTLTECFDAAIKIVETGKKDFPTDTWVILFSPSSKSFEKFKNEFDRGEQFNELVDAFFQQ